MVAVLAALYIAYALTLKKWDYASEAKRTERRTQLKELGLSNTFYFIHAGTLFILNAVSGGLFAAYWLFRQWQAVLVGFRRMSCQPLAGGAFVRTTRGAVKRHYLPHLRIYAQKIPPAAVGVGYAVAGRFDWHNFGKTALLAGLLLRAVGGSPRGPATPFKRATGANSIRQTKARRTGLCHFWPGVRAGRGGRYPHFYPLKTERFLSAPF